MKYSLLDEIPSCAQRQDSTQEQLSDLMQVATKLGMYDAIDFIRQLQRDKEILDMEDKADRNKLPSQDYFKLHKMKMKRSGN